MSMTFTKLFSSITASTIWAARDQTRIVWITMLAMADQHGRVWASIPGLANIARVSIPDCETALSELMGPDKYSRTKDNDGRRLEEIDGGWRLLNHAKYRAIRDEESIKESKRRYINAKREAERAANASTVEASRTESNSVDRGRANTEAEAEAEEKKEYTPRKRSTPAKPSSTLSVEDLKAEGIDEQQARDWLKVRKDKRLPLTRSAWDGIKAEIDRAAITPAEAIAECNTRGWGSFKADWYAKGSSSQASNGHGIL